MKLLTKGIASVLACYSYCWIIYLAAFPSSCTSPRTPAHAVGMYGATQPSLNRIGSTGDQNLLRGPQKATILYYTILYYTILYYTILYYTILYYTILYYTILYYTILYYTILYYTILYYTILYYTILYYTILYYTILYYTILYYTILYYTILYYTILYYTILYYTILYYTILLSRNERPSLFLNASTDCTKDINYQEPIRGRTPLMPDA